MRHKWFVLVVLVLCGPSGPSWALDNGAVYRVWPRLIEAAKPNLPIEVQVIQDRQVNAFADSDQRLVAVYTGLLEKLGSDDQLAWVFSHEIAHITRRHRPVEKAFNNNRKGPILSVLGGLTGYYVSGKDPTVALAGAMVGETLGMRKPLLPILGAGAGYAQSNGDPYATATGAAVGAVLTVFQYSRHDERDADETGNGVAARAGYNPAAGLEVLEILSKHSAKLPACLSTHPGNRERQGNLKKWLAANPSAYQPQRYQPVASTTAKRTIIVQFDGSLYDPWMARVFLQVMAGSSKLRVVAYGGDREEIKRAQGEFGIPPEFTNNPQDIWLLGMAQEYHFRSKGLVIGTPWGAVGYYKNGDQLVAGVVATPYDLKTGELKGDEALIANGRARMSSGSFGGILVGGGIGWDTRQVRSYPEGEAFYQACLDLLQRFEAAPTRASQPTGLPTYGVGSAGFPLSAAVSNTNPRPGRVGVLFQDENGDGLFNLGERVAGEVEVTGFNDSRAVVRFLKKFTEPNGRNWLIQLYPEPE